MHRKVSRLRGTARGHLCVRCDRQAHVWAQVHTESGLDPWADYIALCRSCHCIYDRVNVGAVRDAGTRRKISEGKRGRKLTQEHRDKIGAAHRGVPKSREHKDKIAVARTGQRHTDETKERIRIKAMSYERERDEKGRFTR
jgi:hypothetical protein